MSINKADSVQPKSQQFRVEQDFLGAVEVPCNHYYGAETMRAIDNFPITGIPISKMPDLIMAMAWIKKAAAKTNKEAGDITPEQAGAIMAACDEIIAGKLHDEFCVDVIQGGAGTSTNMNVNEVIANRALEIMGHERGEYQYLHPKDHVNRCQSTNDVYATAIRLTVVQINNRLSEAVLFCADAFSAKAQEFQNISKLGRTQLQDAVPMTVGQEMQAFADVLREDVERIAEIRKLFMEVNLGGSAIGTAVGVSDYYLQQIVRNLSDICGLPLTAAVNRIEATWDTGLFVYYSGLLKRFATKLSKISNDLRLLSSGPAGGLGELCLPRMQPGSSIMPGKVNPVIPEVVNQVCFRVFGADTTITFAAESGQLQLNAMEPVIIWSIYESCTSLISAIETLVTNCVQGITVDETRIADTMNRSTARVTSLAPIIGYSAAAKLAQQIVANGATLEEAIDHSMPERADELAAFLANMDN
ncbi:aspartate ammonia-lyase [Parasphingorhabdus sp.]|uniref:aspartate ammonia-lyase n=1 Tax=Parasphingorhabdus sp. TaxID=2709688 RepID=UPI0032645A3D